MDPKSAVIKSKSSNSAISKKSKEDTRVQYNMKSRSNAKFPHHALKKRGVYVEKRSTKINLVTNDEEVDCVAPKPPPRPRPGQKPFLTSVLNILSKSTTGTQYPAVDKDDENDDNDDNVFKKGNNTKEKFKSRVLGKKFVREDRKKTIVLQSKKEIAQTPSNYSSFSFKESSKNSKVSNVDFDDSSNAGGKDVAEELKNAVLEGRNKILEKQKNDEEPKTLVSDGTNSKDQNNFYNFFVDLLETTISVYNVKAEYDKTGKSDPSKSNLQINESVAKKLNVGKANKTIEFDEENLTRHYAYSVDNDTDYEREFVDMKREPSSFKPSRPVKIKKMKADSFFNPTATKKIPQKSKSVEISRKTIFKNKNDLINVLKQELELKPKFFEEPKSIFQALKVMARNKKKISFDPSLNHKTFTDECDLKRRKVILSSRKCRKRNKDVAMKNTFRPTAPFVNRAEQRYNRQTYKDLPTVIPRRQSEEINNTESYHSLEVYDFEYDPNMAKEPYFSKSKDVSFMYHSSPSDSDVDFNFQDAILNPVSTLSSIR